MSRPASRFVDERTRLIRSGWEAGAETALAEILSQGIAELSDGLTARMAVVATGGFGRGVMALRSDVDLLFVHGGNADKSQVREVLRPLWDAGLKVGHRTDTPRGAVASARTRTETMTALLTARLLWGDAELFGDFRRQLDRTLRKDRSRLMKTLAAEERARRAAEPYRLMAADLKTGRGGIRTADLVGWRNAIEGSERHTDPTGPARATLTAARSALHAVSGRAHDSYDFELREPSARWLGTDVVTLGRRVLEARSGLESMVEAIWPELALPRTRPSLIDSTRREAAGVWTSLVREGSFDDQVPDLRRLLDHPHIVPFHRYPVAEHSLATAHRVWDMAESENDPIAREALTEISDMNLLAWSALLHDIGKGRPGDHAKVGAAAAAELLPGLGIDDEHSDLLRRLIENHLLLADLATTLDADDPAVIAWVADRVGDIETLRYLYLLTVADSRATGSDTWSPWRAELLRRAYRRLEREFVRRSMPPELFADVLADEVLAVGNGELQRNEVVNHLSGFSDTYRTGHAPEVIRDHVLLARMPLEAGGGRVMVIPGSPTRLVVTATDRPGLLLQIAGVMAANRLSIVDARFATRSDSRVFDTFDVIDGTGETQIEASRLATVDLELGRVLRGGFDVSAAIAEKRRAYRHTQRAGVTPSVTLRRTPAGGGMIEVECADRIGLLYDIGAVIHRFGMSISRARIDTRGGVAYDVFTVSRMPAATDSLEQALLEAIG